jgi:hypothetical protein
MSATDPTTTTSTTGEVAVPQETNNREQPLQNENDDDDDTSDESSCELPTFAGTLARKQQGNDKFTNGQYEQAAEIYKECWALFEEAGMFGDEYVDSFGDDYVERLARLKEDPQAIPQLPLKYRQEMSKSLANASECYLRLENYPMAASTAIEALKCDPDNVKARYREAKALFGMKKYYLALSSASQVPTQEGARLMKQSQEPLDRIVAKNRRLFRRIIDSYRLRVEDEYVQTGDCDSYSLYGRMAEGHKEVAPLKHFRAYVRMGVAKKVLPKTLSSEPLTGFSLDFSALLFMTYSDEWHDICLAVEKHDVETHYREKEIMDSVASLRALARDIMGPIQEYAEENQEDDIHYYFSDRDSDSDGY